MRLIPLLAAALLAGMTGGLAVQLPGRALADPPGGPGDVLRVRRIECEGLLVRAPGSKRSVAIAGHDSSAGIWINGADGRCIALADVGDYSFVGLYKDVRREGVVGCDLAMAVDSTGAYTQRLDAKGERVKVR